MRLIDAEAFEKQIEKEIIRLNTNAHKHFCSTGEKDHITSTVAGVFIIVKEGLNRQPTIEAKPVVHAHWDKIGVEKGVLAGAICSRCKVCAGYWDETMEEFDYCPYCGAQMDEVASDTNVGSKGVKIPVLSMEDVTKIAKEMEK